jgi:hypothetical protein
MALPIAALLPVLGDLIGKGMDLADKMHTSDEEKIKAKSEMLTAQADLTNKIIQYESDLVQAKSSIVLAEAQGDSWLQRNWRPMVMVSFAGLAVGDSLGILANPLADDMWLLLQIGLGGYVVGRSGEKIVKSLKQSGG